MKQNIQRTEQRGENIDSMKNKSNQLHDSSLQFQRGTNRVKKRLYWKDKRMLGLFILGFAVIVVILALGSAPCQS